MNKIQTFQEFLAIQSTHIPLTSFIVNLILAAFLATILSYVYVHCGRSLSNRKMFADNFIIMALTTTTIITIVKSSLALSLGLVGALSIVRFRAAIKEPEELSYLFLTIAIGLGLGANQLAITISAFIVTVSFIALKTRLTTTEKSQNLYLTITNEQSDAVNLEKITEILKKYCNNLQLRRFDETKDILEASFMITYDTFENLTQSKDALRELSKSIKITFLDNKGIS